jgi:hypothetical protein
MVTAAFSVSTCLPAGTAISSVEIRAQTLGLGFDSQMGVAAPDPSRPGVYTLAASVGSGAGQWPSARLDPNSYRFYAKVTTTDGTSYSSTVSTITLTDPVGGGNVTKARIVPRTDCPQCLPRFAGSMFQGSNDNQSWTTLAVITGPPTIDGSWNEYAITTRTNWRYLRYLANPGPPMTNNTNVCSGEIVELQFWNGTTNLTPSATKFGSPGMYQNTPSYSFQRVFDNDLTGTLFWHGDGSTFPNYAGIDLGASCSAPTIKTSAILLCSGQQATLTATGCPGTVTWSTGQTGSSITVSPTSNTNYTATCTSNGCVSGSSNVVSISMATAMPTGWTTGTIGTPPVTGCAAKPQSGSLVVRGVGNVPGATSDAFPYVYKTVSGDITIIAKVAGLPSTDLLGDGPRAGIIFRSSTATNASFIWLVQEANGAIGNYRRPVDGGSATFGPTYAQGTVNNQLGQAWIKMVKVGNTISSYYSTSTNPESTNSWSLLNTHTDVTLGSNFLVGFTAFNYNYGVSGAANSSTITEAVFSNVTINGVSF